MRAAIQNYEERHGLVKEQKPTTVDVVRRRLKKVMNPLAGLDVVRTNLVKSVDVEEGTVRVVMDLPADPPVRIRHKGRNHGEDRAPLGRARSSGRIIRIAPCCRFGDSLKGAAILAGEATPLTAATHCASKEAGSGQFLKT